MSNISFGNLTYQNTQQQLKNPAAQPEFRAIDKQKIKEDALELSTKAKDETAKQVKENFIFRTLRNTFGVEDPKKFLKSAALTVTTVVGLAVLGNKASNSTADLGNKVDKFLENNKTYNAIGDFFNKVKGNIKGFLGKSKTFQDISETFKNRVAKPICDMTRGYGRGFVSIFSLTPVDIFEKAFKQAGIEDVSKATAVMKKLVGDVPEAEKFAKEILGVENVDKAAKALKKYSGNLDNLLQQVAKTQNLEKALTSDELAKQLSSMSNPKKATKLLKKVLGEGADSDKIDKVVKEFLENRTVKDNRAFCESVSNAMRKHLGCAADCADDYAKFNKYLQEMQKGTLNGVDISEFINVNMSEKSLNGIIGSWWPVNIVNSIGKKFNPNFNFCRGNLGDSLVKFNAVNGSLAKTSIGSLVQKSITVPTESISNFVNDKSGLGVFLCGSIMSLYNNVQDAPKDKKVATIADDYIGTIGSIAIATPMAFGATYGLASLKNLKGDTIITKALKQAGKVFGMGLERYAKDGTKLGVTSNPVLRVAGGALRLALVMFVFNSQFSKPIRGAIHKIFGKPYDKAEEERTKALEAQKNQIVPELGITQGEFVEKLEKNPEAVQRLQTDPKLAEIISKNPKKILDLLDGKEVTEDVKPNGIVSPLNAQIINRANANQQQAAAQTTQTPFQSTQPAAQTAQSAPAQTVQTANQPAAQPAQAEQKNHDTATYIPSSDFIAKSSVSPEQSQEIEAALARADKVLAKAQKFIG